MKKFIITTILLCSVAAFAHAIDKPLGVEEYTSIDELAGAVAAYFPRVQGEVNDIKGERITLTLGRKDGISTGMTLTLWRVAKEILHPITNAVIGRTEEEVGTVEVTAVNENSSTAVLSKKLKEPRPGDKARITPRKINLALVPVKVDSPDLLRDLAKALSEGGRFSVLDAEKTNAFLKDHAARDAAMVVEMGRAFTLDAVVAVSAFPAEGKTMVTARILYADDGRLLDTVVATIAKKAGVAESLGVVKPFFVPVQAEREESPELPVAAQFFARADLQGDGAVEFAFSDGSRLHIYRQEPSGWKEVWTEVLRGADVADIRHVSLDVADINGNGRPELFVTEMIGDKVVTTVTEWQDGTFRRIAEVPGFLRVVTSPGKPPILIGLAYDPAKFFSGQPKEYAWSGNTYVPGAAFPLPAGVQLYSFTLADFGDGRTYLVAVNDDNRLVVYSGETMIWKSEEEYVGRDTVVLRPMTVVEGMTTRSTTVDPSANTKNREVHIRGRIVALDMDGDGRQEIILTKNPGGGLLSFDFNKKTDLKAFRWTGMRLEDRWSVLDIAGAVLDLQAERQGAIAQVRALVRSSGAIGLIGKTPERVMLYTVK